MTDILKLPVTKPGLYAMTEGEYHADPCLMPSLSRSIGQKLLDESARHAWTAHPRLNAAPKTEEKPEKRAEIGSAAHARLLNQPTEIVEVKAKAYQSNAAKAERAAAHDAGKIPLLTEDVKLLDDMMNVAKRELSIHEDERIRALVTGEVIGEYYNEVTACWRDVVGGHWCRARIDRLVIEPKRITVIDYKTTEMSAAPDAVQKTIYNNEYELQDGFYRRGLRHLFPQIDKHEIALDFLFIVQEQKAPHEITVAKLDIPGRQIGEKKASAAIRMWDHHVTTNEWPGYPSKTKTAEMPPYTETRWLAREIEDERLQNLPFDPLNPFEEVPHRPKPIALPC
ncbi:PD-(D/E)XK nuclease-like domain-containing protein [Brucella ciceri]|uniref:PD-(D/E)XK nuclease-like domain-containing protein n=1 Tax=Brucella ciceri TaxID=391287 RepID=UPI001F143EF6|nr:PD-(D/E)XK nuclease-like domain-containing protein [Brucella ciceri]MCH6203405.1 PD-(D/E)XK nuclease-like domain-containing protein [Brucella ciceri]